MALLKKKLLHPIVIILCFINFFLEQIHGSCNVNLIGFVHDIRSVSHHTTGFIESLAQDVTINLFKTDECSLQDFPSHYNKIVENGIDLTDKQEIKDYIKNKNVLSGVTIFTGKLWPRWTEYRSIPNKSIIKFAYCVTESFLIPKDWVDKLNNNFDGVLVPDEWLVNVFKNSGVNLPIFVLPEVLDLDPLLKKTRKIKCHTPFTFGFSGGFWPRKNHELLMKSFVAEFRDNPDVMLKMHGRFEKGFEKTFKVFNQIKSSNITLEQKAFDRQGFQDFLTSLDCYVSISKAEGFSIIPREALAAGIPCILSDNTAQKVICSSGYVYSVPSQAKSVYCSWLRKNTTECNCTIEDVRAALRTVYQNYQHYLKLAQKGRQWTEQYCVQSLKKKYQNLVLPSLVILGDKDELTDDYLMTASKTLFARYKILCNSNKTIFQEIKRPGKNHVKML